MNKCIITSNFSLGRAYDVATSSAMKAAKTYGRCEGGEVVTIYNAAETKIISQVRWTPEDGGKYVRTSAWNIAEKN